MLTYLPTLLPTSTCLIRLTRCRTRQAVSLSPLKNPILFLSASHHPFLTDMLSLVLFACLITCIPRITATSSTVSLSPPVCTSPSHSQPNPIANEYKAPNIGTGTSNGTLAVIPIRYDLARSLIPAQYPILKNVYPQLFPNLGPDMYPVCLHSSYWLP